MRIKLPLILLIPVFSFCQTQIGSTIFGLADDQEVGYSVSMSSNGEVVAIGALTSDSPTGQNDSGHVEIYKRTLSGWDKMGSNIYGEGDDDFSGQSVSLSRDGSVVAIGALYNNGHGHVRVYEFNDSTLNWEQIGQDIDGEAAGDNSGYSVSLSSEGTIVAVGAPYNNGNGTGDYTGHVKVYLRTSTGWVQLGQELTGKTQGDQFGTSVSLSYEGSTLAVGAPYNNGNTGYTTVYELNGDTWTSKGDIPGKDIDDYAGYSVSLSFDGSAVAIGAPGKYNNATNAGHVRIYKNESDTWTISGNDIEGVSLNDRFGTSVSLSANGSTVAIGAPFSNDGYAGIVQVYKNTSNVWTQIGNSLYGTADSNDQLGTSVSIDGGGNIFAMGAPYNGNRSGFVKVYNLSSVLSIKPVTLFGYGISPNPATHNFTITLNEGETLKTANIYDGTGRFIKASNKTTIPTTGLSTGLYYIHVTTSKGEASEKLIIQ